MLGVWRRGDAGGRGGRPAAKSQTPGGRQLVSDGPAASGGGQVPRRAARKERGEGRRRGRAGKGGGAEKRASRPDGGAARADTGKGGKRGSERLQPVGHRQ